MPKQSPQSPLRVVDPSVEPETQVAALAASALLPVNLHEAARKKLADAIANAHRRREHIASLEARLGRAHDVLYAAMGRQQAAEKELTDAKRQSLFNAPDENWRESFGVVRAQEEASRAGEEADLARGVRDETAFELEGIKNGIDMTAWLVCDAVAEVARTHPKVPALIAEAKERYRAWREIEQVLDVFEGFYIQSALPGWSAIGDSDGRAAGTDVRARQYRETIASLHLDAAAEFPS
ncbi:hypothetical protein MKK75_04890 [Methylobacterium sp. J-030]|uniref:hypothetical protein n=1 Tax=Methylobacterium sp. J-030 TaxID=2836627 RepID=UPI001FBA5763|nr:hypothetical protein [Methylobacterium sp. J-030]MCJ2068152.1 hypothetical protein [Methylobacterium sp. J-030]